jgi:hypothetical protein
MPLGVERMMLSRAIVRSRRARRDRAGGRLPDVDDDPVFSFVGSVMLAELKWFSVEFNFRSGLQAPFSDVGN